MSNPWNVVREFERAVADLAGAKYGVAVDTGTAAIHLCCEWFGVGGVTLPAFTYVSVPCCVVHAGGWCQFSNYEWTGEYRLDPYPIIDSACRFTKGMYKPGEFRCLSFQQRKHLKIGRGGMILCDNQRACDWFKQARFSGRHEVPLTVDIPDMLGWHYFMEPERAAKGLWLMSMLPEVNDDLVFNYPDIRKFSHLYERSK